MLYLCGERGDFRRACLCEALTGQIKKAASFFLNTGIRCWTVSLRYLNFYSRTSIVITSNKHKVLIVVICCGYVYERTGSGVILLMF